MRLPRLNLSRLFNPSVADAIRQATAPEATHAGVVGDGRADPGEVVWAWVPFQEDPTRGKDRPVVVVAVAGDEVLALPMTSKDHDRDASQETREGRFWMDVGTGAWDRQGRPSEVRLDRVVRLRQADVRREGDRLDPGLFEAVCKAARGYNNF